MDRNTDPTRPKTVLEQATLSDEELRIKVAELCGWKWRLIPKLPSGFHQRPSPCGPNFEWSDPNFKCPEVPIPSDITWDELDALPCYLYDLNKMHEAEKIIPTELRYSYWNNLADIAGNMLNGAMATARQRAEAFVLTLGGRHRKVTSAEEAQE